MAVMSVMDTTTVQLLVMITYQNNVKSILGYIKYIPD